MAALAFTLLAIESAGAAAAETWEGLWAKTVKECRSREGADLKTMIDLRVLKTAALLRFMTSMKTTAASTVMQSRAMSSRCD